MHASEPLMINKNKPDSGSEGAAGVGETANLLGEVREKAEKKG